VNPRNLGGGAARVLDPAITAARRLDFFRDLPAVGWESAVCEAFRLPAGIEAITGSALPDD